MQSSQPHELLPSVVNTCIQGWAVLTIECKVHCRVHRTKEITLVSAPLKICELELGLPIPLPLIPFPVSFYFQRLRVLGILPLQASFLDLSSNKDHEWNFLSSLYDELIARSHSFCLLSRDQGRRC